MLSVSEKIKVIMSKEDINQRELANKIGVHESTVSLKLKNNNFTTGDLDKFSKALGCKYEVTFKTDTWTF